MAEININLESVEVRYDSDDDVLYVSFGEPQDADDSELLPNGIVVRYKDGKPIGFTVVGAKGTRRRESRRKDRARRVSH